MRRITVLVAVLALSAPAAAEARTGLSRVQAAGDTTRVASLIAGNINDTLDNYSGWSARPTYPRDCGRANRYLVYCTAFVSGTVYDPSIDLSQDVECDITLRWYKFRDGARRWRRIGDPYCYSTSGYYAHDGNAHANVPLAQVEWSVKGAIDGAHSSDAAGGVLGP